MTDEHSREDIARTVNKNGYLVVVEPEELTILMVVADDTALSLDTGTGDNGRAATDVAQTAEHLTGLIPRHSLLTVGCRRQVASFGIVRECQVGHADHLSHQLHRALRDTVVQSSAVAHDRVDEDGGATTTLLRAVGGYKLGLLLTEHQSRTDGIKREAEVLPYRQNATHVFRRIHHVELAIVEGVRHERRREVVCRMPQISQNRHHGYHTHMAVAYNIVDKQYLLHCGCKITKLL